MGSFTETSFNQQAAGIKDKAAHWQYHIEQWQLSDLTQAVLLSAARVESGVDGLLADTAQKITGNSG